MTRIRAWAVAAMTAVFVMTASEANAQWLRAESERFVVYSNGSERELLQYTQTLETFDRVLRLFMGMSPDQAPPRKLPIYLIGHERELLRVLPSAHQNQTGVYIPAEQDIFAVALRARGHDMTLLHEYAHHFMFQNFDYPYPAWFVEGFAEYYSTFRINSGAVDIGRFDTNRAHWLVNGSWIPMEDLLRGRGVDGRNRYHETYYPLAWLLTHWFLADNDRRAMLGAYLNDVGSGGDAVEAFQTHTGLTLDELRSELRSYLRGRINYRRLSQTFPAADVSIQRLGPSENALLLANQRLKLGRDLDDAFLDETLAVAARWPQDPFARRVEARIHIARQDLDSAMAALGVALVQAPGNVEAHQLSAHALMSLSDLHAEGADAARAAAQGHLQQAFALDDVNYLTFLMIAENRAGAPSYPTENDMAAWQFAFAIAPQLSQARFGYAQALIFHNRNAEAMALLLPLLHNPHHQQNAGYVQALISRAEGRMTDQEDDASFASQDLPFEDED